MTVSPFLEWMVIGRISFLNLPSLVALAALMSLGDDLASESHVLVVEYVPESVVDHGVDDLLVVHLVSPPRTVEQVGGVGHALHSSSDEHLVLPGLDGVGGEHGGLESGSADVVHGERTDLHGEAGADGCLPGGILSETCADDVTHDAFLDVLGLETGTGDDLLHDHGPEIGGFETGEALAVFSYRRPYGAYDDCFVHGMFPRLVIGVLYKIVSIIKYDH